MITSDKVEIVPELYSSQEEADTRIMLHLSHISRFNYKSAIVASIDTDVRLLCIAFIEQFSMKVFQKSGTENRVKYVNINDVHNLLGNDVCQALLGMHAFTGCDSVSCFAGKGKLSALKLLRKHKEYRDLFNQFGTSWDLTEEIFLKIQAFTCELYGAKKGEDDVNNFRYKLFCAKQGKIEAFRLPPCADCLNKHAQRACYQTAIWKRGLDCNPEIPTPVGKGWELNNQELVFDWMDGQPAPQAVLELMACSCSRACKAPNCKCINNGLYCSDMCKLAGCDNMQSDLLIEDESYDEDNNFNDDFDDDDD